MEKSSEISEWPQMKHSASKPGLCYFSISYHFCSPQNHIPPEKQGKSATLQRSSLDGKEQQWNKEKSNDMNSRIKKPTAFLKQLRHPVCSIPSSFLKRLGLSLENWSLKSNMLQDPGEKCISCAGISKKRATILT